MHFGMEFWCAVLTKVSKQTIIVHMTNPYIALSPTNIFVVEESVVSIRGDLPGVADGERERAKLAINIVRALAFACLNNDGTLSHDTETAKIVDGLKPEPLVSTCDLEIPPFGSQSEVTARDIADIGKDVPNQTLLEVVLGVNDRQKGAGLDILNVKFGLDLADGMLAAVAAYKLSVQLRQKQDNIRSNNTRLTTIAESLTAVICERDSNDTTQ